VLSTNFQLKQSELQVKIETLTQSNLEFTQSEASTNSNSTYRDLTSQRDRVRRELSTIETSIKQTQLQISQFETQLQQSQRNQVAVSAIEIEELQVDEELKSLKLEYLECSWLTKNVGGFKSWKLQTTIDRLNELLSEALADLDGSFEVYCQPYRIKSGAEHKDFASLSTDDVVNEFTVYVREGIKKETPSYMYSGGEISLIAIPFLVAFWRLTDEQGCGTNLLLLDEIAGAFDARNSQIVTSFVESLKQKGKTVLLTSHNALIDQTSFDEEWVAVKDKGVSVLHEGRMK
jgi:chromosome segregation ATPase